MSVEESRGPRFKSSLHRLGLSPEYAIRQSTEYTLLMTCACTASSARDTGHSWARSYVSQKPEDSVSKGPLSESGRHPGQVLYKSEHQPLSFLRSVGRMF